MQRGPRIAVTAAVGWWWLDRQADLARDVTTAEDEGRVLRDEAVRVGGDAGRTAEAERAARRAADARSDDPQRRLAARRAVRLWQEHRERGPVRDPAAQALPAAERTAWEAFWRDVAELVRATDTAAR